MNNFLQRRLKSEIIFQQTFWAYLFIILQLCSLSSAAEDRLALLIGNSKYSDNVGALVNPPKDVSLLQKSLVSLHFKVNVISEVGYAAMEQAVKEHIQKVRNAGEGAISFIYYSGHGASDSSTGMNYLIPIDVPTADEDSLWTKSVDLKADVVDRLAQQAPSAIHFVVVDACRNELQLKRSGKKLITVNGKAFTPTLSTGPVLVAYSTAAGRPASDYGISSGPYARALAEEIVVPGVEAITMFRAVQLRVQKSIGQQPYLSIPGIQEIYFAGKSASDAPVKNVAISDNQAFEIERASSRKAMKELLLQLKKTGQNPGGVFVSPTVWPVGTTLRFCFKGGDVARRRYVADVASQWTLYGNVRFDFGPRESPRECNETENNSMAVSFIEHGNWAFIGTDMKIVPNGAPVVSLESIAKMTEADLNSGKGQADILHEFGHVLGLVHSWSFPNCEKELDWPVIYQTFSAPPISMTRDMVDLNFKPKTGDDISRGVFDKYSVMGYALPEKFFKKGKESSCFMEAPQQLSLQDKLAIFEAYGDRAQTPTSSDSIEHKHK